MIYFFKDVELFRENEKERKKGPSRAQSLSKTVIDFSRGTVYRRVSSEVIIISTFDETIHSNGE